MSNRVQFVEVGDALQQQDVIKLKNLGVSKLFYQNFCCKSISGDPGLFPRLVYKSGVNKAGKAEGGGKRPGSPLIPERD